MTFDTQLSQLAQALDGIISPEISLLLSRISEQPGSALSPFVSLPAGEEDELYSNNIARLIAKTSNEYAQATRLASLARAQYKIAVAAYKFKFRTSLGDGKNRELREAQAYANSETEYNKMTLLESIVELCEGIESSTRIASESARRMLLAADQYSKALVRSESYERDDLPSDFSTY